MRLSEKADEVGGHFLANPVDIDQPRPRLALRVLGRLHLAAPIDERSIVAGEQPCRRRADLRNSEALDEAVERNPPALVDRSDQLAGADLAPALALHDRRGIESEDVARLADQPVLPKGRDMFLAEPLDVEAVARDEMTEPLDGLRGTDQPAGAAPRHLTRLAHREAAADRAMVGKLVRLRILRPAVEHDRDDLWDHVTGALDDDGVADPDILARDLVLIVQGGTLHDDPADGDRLEHRHRGQRALAADLDRDVTQHSLCLLCGKFLSDRPARRPADQPGA